MRCWGAMGLFVPCLGGLTVAGTKLAIEGSRASLKATDEHVPEISSYNHIAKALHAVTGRPITLNDHSKDGYK